MRIAREDGSHLPGAYRWWRSIPFRSLAHVTAVACALGMMVGYSSEESPATGTRGDDCAAACGGEWPGRYPRMRQRQLTTGLVCMRYLESCPRTAPFGNAALWTLT